MLLLLPGALFLLFFHPQILDPRNFGWLLQGTDNGENALGLHAWLNDRGAGPGLRTTLLNAPEGVALLFTDSNPLLGLLTAPFARLMPPDLQFVGPWILLCLVLQALFARTLLRPFAPSRTGLLLGVALLLLLPTLYARYIHANLMAHWLILAALCLFADPRRAGDARWWAPLLMVSAVIHNYLLFMVAAIWASALLERFFAMPGRGERLRLAGGAAITLAAVALVIAGLGIDGGFVPTRTYGVYGMSLDALWNPSNPSYSTLLPATTQRLRREFEGFQYLGAGLLLLIAMAPFIAARTAGPAPVVSLHRRLLWLVPACLALTLLAVSHQVDWAGRTLFEAPLAAAMIAALDPLRASARLFWPVAYILVLFAITAAYRLSPPRAVRLLAVVLALQLGDMTNMVKAIRHVTADASRPGSWRRTADPRWTQIIADSRDVAFVPVDIYGRLDLFQEVAWRAVSAGKPVRVVYAARNSALTDARLAAEQRAFETGRLVPDRLYVLDAAQPVPRGAEGRAAVLDGVRLILPVNARLAVL